MSRLFLFIMAGLISACAGVPDRGAVVGNYSLVSVNGQKLPVDKGPLPSRGTFTDYNYVLAEGHLRLQPDGRFQIYYEHQNSKTAQVLARHQQTGTYAISGNRLILQGSHQVYPSGQPNRWEGVRSGNMIKVQYDDQEMVFRR